MVFHTQITDSRNRLMQSCEIELDEYGIHCKQRSDDRSSFESIETPDMIDSEIWEVNEIIQHPRCPGCLVKSLGAHAPASTE